MRSSVINRRDLASKTVKSDHFVAVVELHDVTDTSYSLDVLVTII